MIKSFDDVVRSLNKVVRLAKKAADAGEPYVRSAGGRRTATGTARSVLARVLPASERRVVSNLQRDLPEIVQRSLAGGQSYDPIKGRFVDTLYSGNPVDELDYGFIMAPRAELPGARTSLAGLADPDKEAAVAQAVSRLASDPDVLRRLRRGDLLGSWVSGDTFVGDPSRRYFTKGGSLVAGRRSLQEAGFAPRTGEYNVFLKDPVTQQIMRDPMTGQPMLTPEAAAALAEYREAQKIGLGILAGGTAGGTAGALSARD